MKYLLGGGSKKQINECITTLISKESTWFEFVKKVILTEDQPLAWALEVHLISISHDDGNSP